MVRGVMKGFGLQDLDIGLTRAEGMETTSAVEIGIAANRSTVVAVVTTLGATMKIQHITGRCAMAAVKNHWIG